MMPLFSDFTSLKILVAEDDHISQKLLSLLLKRLSGSEPDLVTRGDDASEVAREGQYDLIFMDYNMPGSNGAEAVRMIRNDPQIRKQPVIVGLSGLFGDEIEKFENAGLDRYLAKPITLQHIRTVLSD